MDREPSGDAKDDAKNAADDHKTTKPEQEVSKPIMPGSRQVITDGTQSAPTVHRQKGDDGWLNKWPERIGKWIDRAATIVIAAFTAALFWVGWLQRNDLVDQGEQTKIAIQATKEIATATKETAVANQSTASATAWNTKWLGDMSGSVKEAVALSQKSNDTAEKAANAAVKSAATQELALAASQVVSQTQLRAFISVTGTLEPSKTTNQLVSKIQVHNSGITPAHNVDVREVVDCLALSALPPDIPPPPPGYFIPPSRTSVSPGNSIQRETAIRMDNWTAWDKKIVRGWVYGLVSYTDEFEKLHFTHFRFYLGNDLQTNQPALFMADDGNDSN
jgi:hypothetical protein